jgi:hypothetical protein
LRRSANCRAAIRGHELSRLWLPLLANAQAAQALLAKKTRDEGLLSEILADIVQEDFPRRASGHRFAGC